MNNTYFVGRWWVPGRGGTYNLIISDLGVESAMSDFEPESLFFTLFYPKPKGPQALPNLT